MFEYVLSPIFWTQLLFAVFVVWTSMSLGKLMLRYSQQYQPITSIFTKDNSTGFNIVYRILFTPILTVFLSIVLYQLNLGNFTYHIWLVSVYVFILQTLLIMILGRWKLVDKLKYFLLHGLSILLTYYIYNVAISKGLYHLLPDEQSIKMELWLIVILFLYGLFRNIPENYNAAEKRKDKYVISKAQYFQKKYKFILDEYEETLADILTAMMVYEDFNRPAPVRLVETWVPSKTRYVMQVYGAKSDENSIKLTAENLQYSYDEYKKVQDAEYWQRSSALQNVFRVHNFADPDYPSRVYEIYRLVRQQKGLSE